MSVQVSLAVGAPSSPLPVPHADSQARRLRIALFAAAVVALLVAIFFGLAAGAL
jgi:hypothetical protein